MISHRNCSVDVRLYTQLVTADFIGYVSIRIIKRDVTSSWTAGRKRSFHLWSTIGVAELSQDMSLPYHISIEVTRTARLLCATGMKETASKVNSVTPLYYSFEQSLPPVIPKLVTCSRVHGCIEFYGVKWKCSLNEKHGLAMKMKWLAQPDEIGAHHSHRHWHCPNCLAA